MEGTMVIGMVVRRVSPRTSVLHVRVTKEERDILLRLSGPDGDQSKVLRAALMAYARRQGVIQTASTIDDQPRDR